MVRAGEDTLTVGTGLREGTWVETGARARVEFALRGGTHVALEEGTRVRFDATTGGDFGLLVSRGADATFSDPGLVGECLGTGGRFCASSDGTHVAYSMRGTVVASSDGGRTFAAVPQPDDTFLDSFAWSGGRWLAVGRSGKHLEEGRMHDFRADGKARLLRSKDGRTWTPAKGPKGTPTILRNAGTERDLWLGTR